MSTSSGADQHITDIIGRLRTLKESLAMDYWSNAEVLRLQGELRTALGAYNAWGPDKLPMHQRARQAARYESESAPLLWPGHGDE